jgi:hypothetical protein
MSKVSSAAREGSKPEGAELKYIESVPDEYVLRLNTYKGSNMVPDMALMMEYDDVFSLVNTGSKMNKDLATNDDLSISDNVLKI